MHKDLCVHLVGRFLLRMRRMDDGDGDGGVDAFAGATAMNWMRMVGQGVAGKKGTSMDFLEL